MVPAQHDHIPTVGVLVGTQWLWALLLCGVLVVTSAAMLRPVVTLGPGAGQQAVVVAACGAAVHVLLVTSDLGLPRQVVGLMVVLAAVPAAVPG